MGEEGQPSAGVKGGIAGRIAVFFLGLAAFIYVICLVQLLITGIDEWTISGVEIRLRPWYKPLWTCIALWILMLAAASGAPSYFHRIYRVFERIALALGVPVDKPGIPWAVLGGFIGAFLGFLFSSHFYYLFPNAAFRIAAATGGLLLSAFLHFLFFRLFESLVPAVVKGVSSWRVATTRITFYLVGWGALLTWPLANWEALGTDPLFPLTLWAALAALFLTWVFLAGWKLSGTLGKVRKISVLVTAIGCVVLVAVSYQDRQKKLSPESPPHRILMITVDTTRADYLSCYGYPRKTSPNIDALAESGVRFTRAYCPRGETDPSHASLLTGFYPRTTGVQTNFQPVTGKVSSMADVILDKGFITICITSRSHLDPNLMNIPGFTDISAPSLAAQSTSAYDAYRRLANKLIEYRDKDVFIWLHFFDPHASYKPHPGYSDQFIEKDKGAYVGSNKKILPEGKSIPAKELKYARDLYAGEIFYMDYWLGRSVDLVRGLGPSPEEPFILVIADHGESLGDYLDRPARYAFGHGAVVYNASSHIPFIISWPGRIKAGQVNSQPVESTDVAATILDYNFDFRDFKDQGMSLRPVIDDHEPSDNLAVSQRCYDRDNKLLYYQPEQFAVIRDNYKLIWADNGNHELFDLDNDWDEKNNLAAMHPEVIAGFSVILGDWLERTPEVAVPETPRSKAEMNVLKALGYIQ